MKSPLNHVTLIEALSVSSEELSRNVIFFHQAAADRLGLNSTDTKALLLFIGPDVSTATELADRLGLTPGAVTPIIDSLEQAKLVRRVPAKEDRRKIIIEPIKKSLPKVNNIYSTLSIAMEKLLQTYTDQELATILAYQQEVSDILHKEGQRLHQNNGRKTNHNKK